MKKILNKILFACLFVVLVVLVNGFININKSGVSVGSVIQTGEYYSTTTIGKAGVTSYMVSECPKTLGTVNVTGATALSALTISDATSTTDLQAVTIATFSATSVGGEYTFDRYLTRGLMLTIASNNGASTTITCR